MGVAVLQRYHGCTTCALRCTAAVPWLYSMCTKGVGMGAPGDLTGERGPGHRGAVDDAEGTVA